MDGRADGNQKKPSLIVHHGTVHKIFSVRVRAFAPLSTPCGVRVRHPLVFSGTQNSKTALTRCESRASKRHQQPDKNKESSSHAHAARHILMKEKLLSHTTFTCEYCSARVLKLWIYHAQKMRVINNGFSVPTIESANHMEKQNTRH